MRPTIESPLNNIFSRLLVVAFIAFACTEAHGAGAVDLTFIGTLTKPTPERGNLTIIQPDGKIIMDGIYEVVNGVAKYGFVRLNSDGTIDNSFNPPEVSPHSGGAGLGIKAIGLQSNGKIMIAGIFNAIGTTPVAGIARLNADGSLDSTFVIDPSLVGQIPFIADMKVSADDTIVFATFGGSARLIKMSSNGALDPSFSNSIVVQDAAKLAIQPDGKIIFASANELKRFNANGTVDGSFITSAYSLPIFDLALQSDGKILVCGQFSAVNGFLFPKIVRINADGSVDGSFATNFGTGGYIFKVTIAPSGSIYVGGFTLSNSSQPSTNLYRLNPSGSVDTSFSQTYFSILDIDVQTDGKVIYSAVYNSNSPALKIFARLNINGSTDSGFQPTFGNHGNGRKIFVQTDGKILVGGDFRGAGNFVRNNLVRFNADGTVDSGFNTSFAFVDQNILGAIDVQPDGKIIIGDSYILFEARRLNADGSTDVIFSGTPTALDVKVLASGKVLIAGGNYIKRFNANGTPDNTFNVSIAGGDVRKITLQPDGKIIIAGNFTAVNTITRGRIARLTADGGLDLAFDTQTGANDTVYDAAVQPDGKIIIGGAFSGINFTNRPRLARLNTDGSLDTSYLPTVDATIYTLKLQSDNKLLIGGDFATVNSNGRNRIARLTSTGALDSSFNIGNGANNRVWDIELQADGKILTGGDFSKLNNTLTLGIARLQNSIAPAKTQFDYDGDGRADVSVFRASENRWYVLRSSDGGVTQIVFAVPADIPAPADFDGDGKTDVAIFRPSNGDWWSLNTINNQQINVHWGQSGDIALPSDFDGDGRADYVVFRPSTNRWLRSSSLNGVQSNKTFGLAGDKPVIGDFDGDGKSDVAIYRPSDGNWWWQSSVDNIQRAIHWGIATDVPAPADFDGDGKTDFAVYRPSTGVWYIYNSSNNSATIVPFGLAEDKPVAGDYDGDGKADIAVFRPSTGIWYLLRSTAGFAGLQFGISSDRPTPNAFIP